MAPILPTVSPDHPCAPGLDRARAELEMGARALEEGNEGRGRVCGRRAVGTLIQSLAAHLPDPYGTHAMANLRGISGDSSLPDEIRTAADRLLGGARSILSGEIHSTDPLGDAACIIRYFVERMSAG